MNHAVQSLFKLGSFSGQRPFWHLLRRVASALICLCLLDLAIYFTLATQSPSPNAQAPLPARMAWHAHHAREFPLIFLGDSRTFCGVHPDQLDASLPVKSLNLSVFSHWLYIQHSQVRDLVEQLPANTLVVWSVGTINFSHRNAGITPYPIGFTNAARFLAWGVAPENLFSNLAWHSPLTHLWFRRSEIRTRVLNALDITLGPPLSSSGPVPLSAAIGERRAAELVTQTSARPEVALAQVVRFEGTPTSVEVFTTRGGYLRHELNATFFRAQQEQLRKEYDNQAPPNTTMPYLPENRFIFEKTLDLLQQANISLLLNVMEDAPFTYGGVSGRKAERARFINMLREIAEPRRIPIVSVNFDAFMDDHYFDYNHLNSDGVALYMPFLAESLRSHVKTNHFRAH